MVHNHHLGRPDPANKDIVGAAQPLGVTVHDNRSSAAAGTPACATSGVEAIRSLPRA